MIAVSGHGTPPRGEGNATRSRLHEGRFGRMFRRLPPAPTYSDDQLNALAQTMSEQTPGGWNAAAPVQDGDNAAVPAAYTYLGQFIDHDLTFDPVSSFQRTNDPDALTNFRSPRLDLDSLFGSGPDDEPFQYTRDGTPRLLLEPNDRGEPDLPRNSQGVALVGDPRNDENVIVSQLHLAMARVFNKLVAQAESDPAVHPDQRFATAQQELRWTYQWIVARDYLPRICGADVVNHLLRRDNDTGQWDVRRPNYQPRTDPYMPVEFSAAAFRFGHSQIRPTYDLNPAVVARPIFTPGDNVSETDDLRGFRPLPASWTIDWSLFADTSVGTPQPSRLINSKLSEALFDLPGETDPAKQSLAFRNLKRGQALELPSGQDVARLLKAPQILSGADLGTDLDPTPLWFYLLKESELEPNNGTRLGHCGAQIVAQVILGILEIDHHSWINVQPDWQPKIPTRGDSFDLADLLIFASA